MKYEEFIKTTDVKVGEHDIEFYFDGMREENGEISGIIKRIRRGDYGKGTQDICKDVGVGNALKSNTTALLDFMKEIGDEHWYQTRILQELELTWNDIEQLNMEKLQKRLETKTIIGKGDSRENEN